MKRGKLSIILVLILSWPAYRIPAQECIIREEDKTIKTYPFSDPDPVPILVKRPALYPYFAFNGYSREGRDRIWKTVRLENDHLRIIVLPGAGGKVYGAVEKSTGLPFVYMNDVMKFRQIALRGPWTSGGIEFNFGIVGHTPATATPVDYMLLRSPDGGVTCVVGNMDLPSRTRWSVAITLPVDKAYLELRSLWFNPTPFNQSYYVWMNNAVKASEDLKYEYPGRFQVPHGYDIPMTPWPVDGRGRDLSWYRNNDFGGDKSYFVLGEYEEFFGGYWHDADFGFGHWALYDDMPGKKMWIWALSRQGAIWERLLTDAAGQYSEPQSGRLYSQSDHEFLTPLTGDTWREILFPFKGIKGLVKASPHGTLNVRREGRDLALGFCALQALEEDLVLAIDGEAVFRDRVRLDPMGVYQKTLDLPKEQGTLTVRVGDKLAYSDDPLENDIGRPFRFQRIDDDTAEGLYLSGEFLEKRREYEQALGRYRACLEREPLHMRALVRAAELHGRRGEYEIGLEYARRALEISMYDPDANYVYGVLSRIMGNLVDAKETLGWAARSMKYRSNAYAQMAEIRLIEKDLDAVLEYGNRALEFNKYNLRAYEVLAIAHRLGDRPREALAVLDDLAAIEPLNHLVRFERLLIDPSPKALAVFKGMIRNEIPHESYLELAISYVKVGREEDAVKLLRDAPDHALVHFWLAYLLRDASPEESRSRLEKAFSLSPRFVFPFRLESIPVFQWAMMERPGDWKPRYYLGLIFWGKGRIEEARMLFDGCQDVDFAPFHIALGHLDDRRTLDHFRAALAVDAEDWRSWYFLARHLRLTGEAEEALELSAGAAAKFPEQTELAMEYAQALFENGRIEDCLALLKNLEVLPYEGGWEAQHLFMRTHVHLAMKNMREGDYAGARQHLDAARTYPEHLGTGKPFDPDFRLQDALEALCWEKTGDREKADAIWKRIKERTLSTLDSTYRYHSFGYLALEHFREYDQAGKLLSDLAERFPGHFMVEWLRARYGGDDEKAEAIETSRRQDPWFMIELEAANLFN